MTTLTRHILSYTLSLGLAGFITSAANAATPPAYVICKKTSSGAITLRVTKCKRGESRLSNFSQFRGSDGSNGSDGADGSIRVYGDGSAGALTVSSSAALSGANHQYTNIVINAGVTLTVPSGTVIRCSGTFTNNGTIATQIHAAGAYLFAASSSSTLYPALASAGPGSSVAIGSQGEFGSGAVAGGIAGVAIPTAGAAQLLHPGPNGGGGGGANFSGSGGGQGGGTITILSSGTLSNAGSIFAQGVNANSGGGGGGGIVILASKTLVTNTGTIDVSGGDGSASTVSSGAGGGGGGGIVHFISTSAPVAGTIVVNGGAVGSNTTVVSNTLRVGGAGGGSCGGEGGAGSNVSAGNASSGNTAGAAGISIMDTADPTSLF